MYYSLPTNHYPLAMLILGIETSCDETSAAVVADGWLVKSCTIASSRKDFERMGGVVPEEAARKQLESILPVIEDAVKTANTTIDDIDAIAVTAGPGLLGSLLVGTTTANVLGSVWNKRLIPVHHTLGHLCSSLLSTDEKREMSVRFPVLTLSVSGGHTDLWLRKNHLEGKLLGTTRDDAAGEAFDKGAVMLGLPYPGGPEIEKMARTGDEESHSFPRPLGDKQSLEYSFSGLKTSLKYLLQKKGALDDKERKNIIASYQYAIIDHLCSRLQHAIEQHPDIAEIHVVGGVSANGRLRQEVTALADAAGIICRFPEIIRFCTDNAAMIASAGFFLARFSKAIGKVNAIATQELSESLLS